MEKIFTNLFKLLGSHSAAASLLEYSDRQYRNIRRKVEKGEALQPRVEQWIVSKYNALSRKYRKKKW